MSGSGLLVWTFSCAISLEMAQLEACLSLFGEREDERGKGLAPDLTAAEAATRGGANEGR